MSWLPIIMKAVSNGNGVLLAVGADEFVEIALYVVIPLWFMSGVWYFYIDYDEQRRAALRKLAEELAEEAACAQQQENSRPSAPTCDEPNRPTV